MITHIVLGDNRLLTSSYTSLLSVDNIRYTSSMSLCLTSCSINITCLCGTYNPTTSTCYTSHKAEFVNVDTEHSLPAVFIKRYAEQQTYVYRLSNGTAMGQYSLKQENSTSEFSPSL